MASSRSRARRYSTPIGWSAFCVDAGSEGRECFVYFARGQGVRRGFTVLPAASLVLCHPGAQELLKSSQFSRQFAILVRICLVRKQCAMPGTQQLGTQIRRLVFVFVRVSSELGP
jgi:hypothetical protein